jgi:hypothetical protein
MDGRVQLPVIEYLMKTLGVEYVDSITEAAPVRWLADAPDSEITRSVMSRIAVSARRHGTKTVAIVAHHDCAGNFHTKQEQLGQLARAVAYIAGTFPDLTVAGLWVDERWEVSEVVDGPVIQRNA